MILRRELEEYPNSARDDAADSTELLTQAINHILTGKRRPDPVILRA